MKKAFKIAVYSGEVPSTVFIERFISGISRNGCQVYLFGSLKKRTSYNRNVRLVTYSENKIQKSYHFLKYGFLLFLFRNKSKKKLDNIIKSQPGNRLLSKTKYYPVLWHRPDIFHIQWAKSIDDWVWVQKFGMKLIVSLRG